MKVNEQGLNGIYPSPLSGARDAQRVDGGRSPDRRAGFDVGMDRVEISDVAETVSNVLAKASVERSTKIARLAEEVRSGGYRVDALQLSRAMIDDALRNTEKGVV